MIRYLLLFYLSLGSCFDYYIFTRTWVPGFCYFNKNKCSNNQIEKFSIHGLWPTWNNGSWPQYCNNQTTNYSRLDSILPDLNYHWSDSDQPDWDLWKHEWRKHGTCALNSPFISDTYHYFSTVLWLDLRLDINYLLNKTIVPSKNKGFNKTKIQQLLGSTLRCKNSGDKSILIEIRNKIENNLTNFQNTIDDGSCRDIVYII